MRGEGGKGDMAEAIQNAFRVLIRDIRSWNRPYEPPARDPRGIGRHFANVGKRLTSAAENMAKQRPGGRVHA